MLITLLRQCNEQIVDPQRSFAPSPSNKVFSQEWTEALDSPLVSYGSTAVLCSVMGPADVKLRDEKLDTATIDVVVRPDLGVSGVKERHLEYTIRHTFEAAILGGLFPRTQIQIVIQVLSDDGGLEATAINAVTMALIDAGVPMKSVVAAVSCCIPGEGSGATDRYHGSSFDASQHSDVILIDPSADELEAAKSIHTFAIDNTGTDAVLFNESIGRFSEEEYFNSFGLCKQAAQKVHLNMHRTIEKKLDGNKND